MKVRLALIFIVTFIYESEGFGYLWSSNKLIVSFLRSNAKYHGQVRSTKETTKPPNNISSRREFNSDALRNIIISSSLSLVLIKNPPLATAIDDEIDASFAVDSRISAQSKSVTLTFEGDDLQVFVDGSSSVGKSIISPASSMKMQARYQVPTKWTNPPDYLDTFSNGSNPLKACERIIVYQAPLGEDPLILEKAASMGVAKALGWLKSDGLVNMGLLPATVERADVISGRKLYKTNSDREERATDVSELSLSSERQEFFEFDIAVAPLTCLDSEKENLRLGFCPYESIILISATIVYNKILVLGVLSTKDEWKRANSDIKRVRSSFIVYI